MKLFIKPQLTTELLAKKVKNKINTILFGSFLHIFILFILFCSTPTAIKYVSMFLSGAVNIFILIYGIFLINKHSKLNMKMIEEEMAQKENTNICSNQVEIEHELSLNTLFKRS